MHTKISIIVILIVIVVGIGYLIYSNKNLDFRAPTSADNAPPGSIHNLPVPEAVSRVRALISEKFKISDGLVIVETVLEKEWPDSCLGLAEPEEICAQVITPGYEITALVNNKKLIYRTNEVGSVIREYNP
jgi:hypothetical protein